MDRRAWLGVGFVGWLAAAGIGFQLTSSIKAQSKAEGEHWMHQSVPLASARAELEQRRKQATASTQGFWTTVAAEAQAFGVKAPSRRALKAPSVHRKLQTRSKLLRPGRSLRRGALDLRVSVEPVRFMRKGSTVKSKHTVLTVTNRGKTPLAYRVKVSSADKGQCRVRGTWQHNALALMPKESAKITVCAGKTAVKVQGLETLRLSELGYHYLSRVPPLALGVDPVQASAHRVPSRMGLCRSVPARALSDALQGRKLQWADLADFYARHHCQNYRFSQGYRRPRRALAKLPVQGTG